MRRVIASEFITLDGVMEDPGGSEQFERGGWALQFDRGPEGDQYKLDEVQSAGALLLGRKTYKEFAEAWPSRTGEFADKMNSMPKYVVSTTLDHTNWNNTTQIRSNIVEEVTRLKTEPGGDILIAGSAQLVRKLMEHGLIDEFRLMVFPIVLGKGKHLFDEGANKYPLRLEDAKPVGSGVLILTYCPDHK